MNAEDAVSATALRPFVHNAYGHFAVLAIAYFLASVAGTQFVIQPDGLSVISPAGGLLLGWLLVIERRSWAIAGAAAIVGGAAAEIALGHSFAVSIGFALVNALEPVLAAAWLVRLGEGEFRLRTNGELLRLFAVPCVVGAGTALVGAGVAIVESDAPNFLQAWRIWWVSHALGAILFGPVIVAWARRSRVARIRFRWLRRAESSALVTLATLAAWYIFAAEHQLTTPLLSLPYPIFPILLCITVRTDFRLSTVAVAVVGMIVAWGTVNGRGPMWLRPMEMVERVYLVQGLIAAICLSKTLLALTIEEQAARELEVRALNLRLRQRIRTIQRTRAELRESEQRFRAIFHSQFQFIGLLSPDGVVLEANRGALAAAGVAPESVIGKHFWDTAWWQHDVAQQQRLREAIARAAAGERVRFEASHPRHDGVLMWVDFSLTPFRDAAGEVVLLIPEGRDLSDRKIVEQALEANDALLRQFVAHAPAAIAMLDNDLRYIRVSERWLADYNLVDRDIIGQLHDDVFPNLPERWRAVYQRVLAGAVETCPEDEFEHNGAKQWLQWEARPWRTSTGAIGGLILFTMNITARKQAEAALRESQERFRGAFDSAPIGVALVALDGRWLKVNDSLCRLFGYTEQELLATDFQSLTHPDDLADDLGLVTRLLAGEFPSYQMEKRYYHKNRRTIHATLAVSLVRDADGRALYFVAQVEDITKRVESEMNLRAREEQHRSVIEALAEGVVVQDGEGVIQTFNDRAAKILGLTRDELTGRTSRDPEWRAVREGGEPFLGEEHPSMVALRTAEPVFDVIMGVEKPAGQRQWLSINAIPFGAASGSGRRVVASFHDVTEQRNLNAKLSASLHEKEMMLREIHHRVKNNLAVIISLFQLQSGYTSDGPTLQLLGEAQNRLRSMALVHEHMYNAADLGAVQLGKYARELVAQLFTSCRLPASKIALATRADELAIGIDRAIPCGMILNELVTNSLKHAFPEDRRGNLCVDLSAREGNCVLRVADDGVGLPPESGERPRRSLGMRLIRSLTRQLGGTITFESTDPGTAATLVFPIGDMRK